MTVFLTNQRLRIWIWYAHVHTDYYAFYTVLRYDLMRCVVIEWFHTGYTVRIPFNLVIVTAHWKEIHK